MKIGSIWFHENFPFEDGSKGQKLIVIVSQKNDTHLICKTTSRKNNYRQREEGCFANKGYYMIPENKDWFTKDTWIQFDIIYRFKITEISEHITRKGNLKSSRHNLKDHDTFCTSYHFHNDKGHFCPVSYQNVQKVLLIFFEMPASVFAFVKI